MSRSRILAAAIGLVALILLVTAVLDVVPARADVLVSPPSSNIKLGQSITSGVWYQSYSGGPRWARISVLTRDRTVLWSRRVMATGSWKYYRYRPRRTGVYILRYRTPGGVTSFRVRVTR